VNVRSLIVARAVRAVSKSYAKSRKAVFYRVGLLGNVKAVVR